MSNYFKKYARFFSVGDFFKYKFFFRIGNNIQNSTLFSIFISFLALAPLLIYFFLIAKNTIIHSSAKINVQEFDVNKRPFLFLNKDNFRLAFRFNLMNLLVFSGNIEDYFDFLVSYKRVSQKNFTFANDFTQNFEIETCKEENFKDYPEYYNLNLREAFCLKDPSMEIGGYWDEEHVGWFEFHMMPCGSFYTNKTTCKDPEAIKKEIIGSYFYVYIESRC